MTLSLVPQVAIEWLKASGERTPERLDSLVEHYGRVNAYDGESIRHFQAQARIACNFPIA